MKIVKQSKKPLDIIQKFVLTLKMYLKNRKTS